MTEKKQITHGGAITSVQFSDDNSHLVVTDAVRRVVPYKIADDVSSASQSSIFVFSTNKRPKKIGLSTPPELIVLLGLRTVDMLPQLDWTQTSMFMI